MIFRLPFSTVKHETDKAVLFFVNDYYFWYARRFLTMPNVIRYGEKGSENKTVEVWSGENFDINIYQQSPNKTKVNEQSVKMSEFLKDFLRF